MKIRLATLRDAEAIAQTEKLAREDGWSRNAVQDSLDKAHVFSLIAETEGEPVAHVLGTKVADEAEILTIAVRPIHRRQGVARALLQRCYDDWSTAGIQSGYLEVRHSNQGARALYQQSGWEEIGHRAGYYRDGETAVLMRWSPS